MPGSSGPSTPARSRLEDVSPCSPPKRPCLPQLPEALPGHEPTVDPIDFLSLHTVLELTFKPRRPAWDVPGAGEQPWWSRCAELLLADNRYQLLQRGLLWLDAAVFLADQECLRPFVAYGCALQVNDARMPALLWNLKHLRGF